MPRLTRSISTVKYYKSPDVPLSGDALAALKGHRHLHGEFVFCQANGRRAHQGMMKHPLWRARKPRSQTVSSLNEKRNRVDAPGIESPSTSAPIVVARCVHDADLATQDNERRREVSASRPADTDKAIRVAAKVAIDAGDLTRARALIDLLEPATPRAAPVLALAAKRGAGET